MSSLVQFPRTSGLDESQYLRPCFRDHLISKGIDPGMPGAARERMQNESSFRSLKVWQASMTLVEEVYKATKPFPANARFGLTTQLRGAAVSVPSNIGEGKRRKRQMAFARHLDIALGSQGELEVQLEIAKRVGLLAEKYYLRLQAQTRKSVEC